MHAFRHPIGSKTSHGAFGDTLAEFEYTCLGRTQRTLLELVKDCAQTAATACNKLLPTTVAGKGLRTPPVCRAGRLGC